MKQKITKIIEKTVTSLTMIYEKIKLFIYDIKYFITYSNYDSKRNFYIIRMLERDINKLEALEEFRHNYCHREKSFLEYCKYRNAYNKKITEILKNIQQYICYYQKIDESLEIPIYELMPERKKSKKKSKRKFNNNIRVKQRA